MPSYEDLWGVYQTYVTYLDGTGQLIWRFPQSTTMPQTPKRQEEEEVGLLNTFQLGADPEFIALDSNGRVVEVQNVLGRGDSVGYDHGGYVIELRPTPHRSAWVLTRNLKELIASANTKLARGNEYGENLLPAAFRAGGFVKCSGNRERLSLGGHIHVDLNPYKAKYKYSTEDGMNSFTDDEEMYTYSPYTVEHGQRMRGLDCFTDALERLNILPATECEERRKGSYGKFGSFRVQPDWAFDADGNQASRTEYRTMPSWLFHPKVTFLCLTGAKLIAAYPQECRTFLGKKPEFADIKRLFESFKEKDLNAKRAMEWLFEGKELKDLQFDATKDFRPAWEAM